MKRKPSAPEGHPLTEAEKAPVLSAFQKALAAKVGGSLSAPTSKAEGGDRRTPAGARRGPVRLRPPQPERTPGRPAKPRADTSRGFVCARCGHRAKNAAGLAIHRGRSHCGERPKREPAKRAQPGKARCPKCGAGPYLPNGLALHTKACRGKAGKAPPRPRQAPAASDEDSPAGPSTIDSAAPAIEVVVEAKRRFEGPPFKCDRDGCGREFGRPGQLGNHLKAHDRKDSAPPPPPPAPGKAELERRIRALHGEGAIPGDIAAELRVSIPAVRAVLARSETTEGGNRPLAGRRGRKSSLGTTKVSPKSLVQAMDAWCAGVPIGNYCVEAGMNRDVVGPVLREAVKILGEEPPLNGSGPPLGFIEKWHALKPARQEQVMFQGMGGNPSAFESDEPEPPAGPATSDASTAGAPS
jgi:hypothetical protein